MLKIIMPNSYLAERRYILNLLFTEFLGLEIEITTREDSPQNQYVSIEDNNGCVLEIRDVLFSTPRSQWLLATSLPVQPLHLWEIAESPICFDLKGKALPVILGGSPLSTDFLKITEDKIHIELDIFGSAFFMLTRYEEYVKPERDLYGRFPVSETLAYQEGFLHRPIINEYIEVLWQLLKTLWPQLTRKERQYQVYLSHDVDEPFYTFIRNPKRILGSLFADVIKRKEPSLAARRLLSVAHGYKRAAKYDPFDTFDFLMDVSERHGLKSAFYFMASEPSYDADNRYNLKHLTVRELLAQIHNREHEIGLHPSLNSYQCKETIAKEFNNLCQVLNEEGIHQDQVGGRHHYLRWSNPKTWQIWHEVGLAYDTTLNFAENPGFRCGICYEYPVFNLEEGTSLNLIERPLIVMERFYQRNSGISNTKAIEVVRNLAQTCRSHNGSMSMLWHNNALMTSTDKAVYQTICEEIS